MDFPFALPTAVAGLTLARSVFRPRLAGAIPRAAGHQRRLHPPGRRHRVDFCRPALLGAHPPAGAAKRWMPAVEEAAAMPRGGPLRTFVSVIAPTLLPTVLTGLALPLRARSGNTARSSSSPATCRQDGDRAHPHRHAPGSIRLHGRHRGGAGADGFFVRPAAHPEHAARLGRPLPGTMKPCRPTDVPRARPRRAEPAGEMAPHRRGRALFRRLFAAAAGQRLRPGFLGLGALLEARWPTRTPVRRFA